MRIEDEIKSNFKDEHHKALINLVYTNFQIGAQMRDFFKAFDVTSQQYNILRILRGQLPQPASIGLLKERMMDKSSDVSRIVDRLLKKGWIERKECKDDRRQKDILINQIGLDLLAKVDKAEAFEEKALANLSEQEAEQLNHLLDKIRG